MDGKSLCRESFSPTNDVMTHVWTKTILFLLLDLLVAGRVLQAATVSVLVVEGGLAEENSRAEASSAWEGGFMDALFEAGHIACNAEMVRQEATVLPSPSFGWSEAMEGGADYLVIVLLDYVSETRIDRMAPSSVSWRLVDKTGVIVATAQNQRMAPTFSVNEDAKNGKDLAKVILVRMRDTR